MPDRPTKIQQSGLRGADRTCDASAHNEVSLIRTLEAVQGRGGLFFCPKPFAGAAESTGAFFWP